jgi:hypothetical protein
MARLNAIVTALDRVPKKPAIGFKKVVFAAGINAIASVL